MTRKNLYDWGLNGISGDEKDKLEKVGIDFSSSSYRTYTLNDLKQILRCADGARENWEIRNKLSGRIIKIVFFTPSFNSGKPDASNYSCAIVNDGNGQTGAISYRPSYVANIESDLVIGKVSSASGGRKWIEQG